MCSLNVDDMWHLFESLAQYQWQCESANESFVSPIPYGLHAQSLNVDRFRDLYHHQSSFVHVAFSHCQSFDYDGNLCPYYDIFDEFYARLDVMIEIMNEQYKHFL